MSVTMLKRIALIAMAVNYIGAFIPEAPIWFQWIGRLAAPLFFYAMAWSLDKTSNKKRYLLRLYVCGILMALVNFGLSVVVQKNGLMTTVTSDIFATLFAGAFFIEVLEYGKKHHRKKWGVWLGYGLAQIAFAGVWAALYEIAEIPYAVLSILSAACGSIFTCEGAFMYVLMGAVFYYTKEDKRKLSIGYLAICLMFFLNSAFGIWGRFFMLLGTDVLVVLMEVMTGMVLWGASFRPFFDLYHMLNNDFQWMMILALPLILCCNKKKGRCRKYFYYIFYPAHVYLLWFLGVVVLR